MTATTFPLSEWELSVDLPPAALEPVAFDTRRPWPLGLPSVEQVIAALEGTASVESDLRPLHLTVKGLLPGALLDAARVHGSQQRHPLTMVAASAWRTLVAYAYVGRTFGVDKAAAQALLAEAADAREKVQALQYFEFDELGRAEALWVELGVALDRLIERSRTAAPTRSERRPSSRSLQAVRLQSARQRAAGRQLRLVFLGAALIAAAFHLGDFDHAQRAPWIVVGDVESGRAFLAPTSTEPDEVALRQLLVEFEGRGFIATPRPSGEWSIRRKGAQP